MEGWWDGVGMREVASGIPGGVYIPFGFPAGTFARFTRLPAYATVRVVDERAGLTLASFARMSATSVPSMSSCPGTHSMMILVYGSASRIEWVARRKRRDLDLDLPG